MCALAIILMNILRANTDLLQLHKLDLSIAFTHYSAILHYSIDGFKVKSHMGPHHDNTYDKHGNFIPSQNSQKSQYTYPSL